MFHCCSEDTGIDQENLADERVLDVLAGFSAPA